MNSPWIQTCTGMKFHFTEVDQYPFDLEDFAQPLSLLCRFVGHISKFYSVGEHCIHVASLLESRGYNPQTVWFGLIHDAGEAFIGDISRPLKHLVEDTIRPIEEKILKGICVNYKVNYTNVDREAVHTADLDLCSTEALKLLPHDPIEDWHLIGTPIVSIDLPCWTPEETKERYYSLFGTLLVRAL